MNELFGRLGARLGVDRTALEDGRRYSSAIPEGAVGRDRAGRDSTHASTGALRPARRPRSSPAHMFGARGSLMGFVTTMMAAGLSADHVPAGLRAPFGLARKVSRDDAFGGIAGTVPGNSFDF